VATDEFLPSRTLDLDSRIRAIEDWASLFSGRQSVDPSEVESTTSGTSGSTGGGGGSGTLIGDVTGPLTANTVGKLRNKLLTGTEAAFALYQYDGTQWVAQHLLFNVAQVATTYPITATDDFVFADATLGGFTVTLPTAVGITGRGYSVKKADTSVNIVTVATTGGQTIDGSASVTITVPETSLLFISNGANWFIN
jgi:hypothetical protein